MTRVLLKSVHYFTPAEFAAHFDQGEMILADVRALKGGAWSHAGRITYRIFTDRSAQIVFPLRKGKITWAYEVTMPAEAK